MFEVCLQPRRKFCTIHFFVGVFSYGKNVTAISPGLGVGRDRSDDRPHGHGDVYLAEKLFLLAVRDDLGDLIEIAHFDGDDLRLDLFRPDGDSFLVHDIMETQVVDDLFDIEIDQPVDLVPGGQGLILVKLLQDTIGIFGTKYDQRLQQFLFGAKIIRDHRQVDPGIVCDVPDRRAVKALVSKKLLGFDEDMFSFI